MCICTSTFLFLFIIRFGIHTETYPLERLFLCSFFCFTSPLEIFCEAFVIRQEGKTGVDVLASVLLNRNVWFCMFEPVLSFSLHQRIDILCWHIVLLLVVKPLVMANILSFTWESSCEGTKNIMLISINGVFF